MFIFSFKLEGSVNFSVHTFLCRRDRDFITHRGTKVYVEARLGDVLVQRLSPVNVDPVSGDFSYDGAMDRFAEFDVSLLLVLGFSVLCFTRSRGM